MKTANEASLTLPEVADHFQQWRSRKQPGARIPDHLWHEAISLVGAYQVTQITRTLRLSSTDLNKRRRRPLPAGWNWNARTGGVCVSSPRWAQSCWHWSSVSWGSEHVTTDPTKPCLLGLRTRGFPPWH
jgi:hypothetical protein